MVNKEGSSKEFLEKLHEQRKNEEREGLWRNLRLDWIRNWDQGSRTAVLLSRMQHTGKSEYHSST